VEQTTVSRPAVSHGMLTFFIIWLAQVVSGIGTSISRFGLSVWVYLETGSATQLALISFFALVPLLLASPLAGALVDRWDRRLALIVSDVGAAFSTLLFLGLLLTDQLQIWHVYVVVAVNSLFGSLQFPAISAATTMLVPKEQLGRANGLLQLGEALGQLITPVLAGVLVGAIGIVGVVSIDLATFAVATVMLLFVSIPAPASSEPAKQRTSLWRDAGYGWTYVRARSGLVGLLIFFAISNYLMETVIVMSTPLILSFSTPAVLGTLLSVAGIGMLVGSVLISVVGVPKPAIYGVFGGILLSGVAMVCAGLAPDVWVIGAASFFFAAGIPIMASSSQTIWQRKVAPDVQGRVFAIRSMLATASLPLAHLTSGPLADYVFNPLLVEGGALAGSVGRVIGVGPSRGIGLMFMVLGGLVIVLVIYGFFNPRLRRLDVELPDAVVKPRETSEAVGAAAL
jgi:MFS transporter, DHA3 family, macrolide efflux protein